MSDSDGDHLHDRDDVFHAHGDGYHDGLFDDELLDLHILSLEMNSTRIETSMKSWTICLSSHACRVCGAHARIGNHLEE